ncbi:MAG TPA: hypothetical protein PLS83_05245, partial [Methanothrix soehngenii]|nr:hypothetical protein [Methanothrix soehngenii]
WDTRHHASGATYGEETLEVFNENDHEFKKIKGMVARFTPKKVGDEEPKPYFVIKLLSASQVMLGSSAWLFRGNSFGQFEAGQALRNRITGHAPGG